MKRRSLFVAISIALFASCTTPEPEVEVASVMISQPAAELLIGETLQLSAWAKPDDAKDKAITWASSKPSVATVSQNGQVSAINEGMTTVTATSVNGIVANCTISVIARYVAVLSVALDKSSIELVEGETEALSLIISPSDATEIGAVWTSSDPSIATVDETGTIYAVGPGEVAITVTVGGKSASCKVMVSKKITLVTGVRISRQTLSIIRNETATLSATVLPTDATDQSVMWRSSDSSVVEVDQDGRVKAKSVGTAYVIVYADDGRYSDTCEVTVMPILIESISLEDVGVFVGSTVSLRPIIVPDNADNNGVSWVSSNTSVAIVNSKGVVTGIAAGAAIVTATAKDGGGQSGRCTVTVKNIAVTAVTLNKTRLRLMEGMSEMLIATVEPEDATDNRVRWESSDESIVTVDANGKITAVGRGDATITVTSISEELTASCEVTVITPEAVDMGLSVKWATFNVGAMAPEEYGDYFAWGETEIKDDYSWTSYKWCNGNMFKFIKYNMDGSYGIVDNKTVLDNEDDAAYMEWGNNWRMATYDEWEELKNTENCNWTWGDIDGVEGYVVKSNINGNSLFLPAGGYRAGWLRLYNSGTYGYYYSSSLYKYPQNARGLIFNPAEVKWNNYYRYCGYSIRPVRVE